MCVKQKTGGETFGIRTNSVHSFQRPAIFNICLSRPPEHSNTHSTLVNKLYSKQRASANGLKGVTLIGLFPEILERQKTCRNGSDLLYFEYVLVVLNIHTMRPKKGSAILVSISLFSIQKLHLFGGIDQNGRLG